MGPYYRNSSQGVGDFIDSFYQHPILMLLLLGTAIGVGVFVWRKKVGVSDK
jgi:hypothetical protein